MLNLFCPDVQKAGLSFCGVKMAASMLVLPSLIIILTQENKTKQPTTTFPQPYQCSMLPIKYYISAYSTTARVYLGISPALNTSLGKSLQADVDQGR